MFLSIIIPFCFFLPFSISLSFFLSNSHSLKNKNEFNKSHIKVVFIHQRQSEQTVENIPKISIPIDMHNAIRSVSHRGFHSAIHSGIHRGIHRVSVIINGIIIRFLASSKDHPKSTHCKDIKCVFILVKPFY